MGIFLPAKRTGQHYSNLRKALRTIKSLSLDISGSDERKFEDRVAGALTLRFKRSFIDQRNKQQVITRVALFDHDHRPDMSIHEDGVAIEVKVIKSGHSFREAIGQSLIYRLGYRFVIIIWVDLSKKKTYKELLGNKKSKEYQFMEELEINNIYCVVK